MGKTLGIYLLAIGTFITGTSEMVVAGIVKVIADDLDVSIALAGQLVTAFSIGFSIGTPIIVSSTSSWERKKVLLVMLGAFFIGNLLFLLPLPFSFLLIIRVMLGVSAGAFIVVATSVAAKLVDPDKIGNAVSTVSLGFGVALVAGVPLGVIFSEWFGWKVIFAILAALSFIIMILLSRLIPSMDGVKSISLKQQVSILKKKEVAGGLLIFFFLISGYGLSYTYLTPYLLDIIHLTMPAISLCMLLFGLFAIIGTRFGGYGADRWGPSKAVTFSILAHVLFLISIPLFAHNMLLTLLFIALWVGIANITIPALQTFFIQNTPTYSELALSSSSSIAQLGLAIGSGFGGFLISLLNTSYYNPLISAGIVIIAFITAIIVLMRSEKVVSNVIH